ncbi:MAG: hypothetical protein KatS3mg104_1793 [Phycisphaerae bacterium]|nr:MAG: hypothetical protein KatS3mg104_1793 [Phycisphaerae bacterium]
MQFTGHTLHFGDTIPGDNPFVLDPDDLSTHVGIFGRSGRGKSKLLEHLLRQVLNEWPASQGGCLVLDPHGPTYDGLLSYAAKLNVRRPIVPIDLRDPSWVVAYHLLRPRGSAKQSVVVDALIEAMLHAWGAADADATPLLARWSGNLFHALYAMRATLSDAMELIVSPTTRRHVAEALGEHPAARDWHLAADAKGVEFEAMVSSTVNRLRRFVGNDTLRMMFGQGDGRPSFDFAKAVAEGWIVLVCLATEGSNVSRENSDLVGSLMLSDLWTSAADRGKRDRQRQYLVVADEFQRYLNPSIAEGLDQSRGFGLAWLLSCQYPPANALQRRRKGRAPARQSHGERRVQADIPTH